MRNFLSVLLLFLIMGELDAQSIPSILKFGDKQFEQNRYLQAIPYYEKVYSIGKKNNYAGYQLGVCYEKTLQFKKAMKMFEVLSARQGHEYQAKSVYKYATLNKRQSNFDLADSIYQDLVKMDGVDPALLTLASRQREGCLLAKREQEQDRKFSIEYIKKLNSDFHDFGLSENPANGNVVFSTSRNLGGTQYQGSQYSGLLPDMMTFEYKSNGNYNNISGRKRFDRLNTKWSEGSGTFNEVGDKFYYTSCEGEDGNNGCKIKITQLIDDKWSDPVLLNEYINEANSENKQPSLSVTGDTLFFSSDRPGGQGGSDIWMSLRGDDAEAWSPAINLGDVINTQENEITPYYSSTHGSLIFSSNGHVGYGGYDIYGAKGYSFFNPDLFNLGFPFNSTWDDTYFNVGDSIGYLSSNKKDKEVLDLYRFSVPDEKLFLSLLFAGELMVDGQVVSKYKNASAVDLVTFRSEDYEGFGLFQPELSHKDDLKKFFKVENVVGNSIASSVTANRAARSGKAKVRQEAAPKPVKTYKTFDNVERLYFDYGDFLLRKQSKQAIADFYASIKNQPYTKINLLSYADHLGAADGNEQLCQERGEAVKKYLMTLGVPESKIQILARGELKSKNDHWYRRVLDRRVELHVESAAPIQSASARGVLLRLPLSLDQVASIISLDAKDVHQWNGPGHKQIEPGHVIRLYIPTNTILDQKYFVTEENLLEVLKK